MNLVQFIESGETVTPSRASGAREQRRGGTVLALPLSISGGNPNSTFCSFVNLRKLRRQYGLAGVLWLIYHIYLEISNSSVCANIAFSFSTAPG